MERLKECSSSVPLEKSYKRECRSSVPLEKSYKRECRSSVPLEKSHQQECSSSVSLEKSHKRDACATLVNFDYGNPLDMTKRSLPHWQQPGTSYFVTFRLADSIPVERVDRIKREREIWLMQHSEPYSDDDWCEYNRLFSDAIQNLLDAGSGSCILKKKEVSVIVKNALLYFNGKRYELGEWIIMPNHVHVIVTPFADFSVEKITHSWKSYTAHEINKALNKSGTIWQHESYDHIIRNSKQLEFISKYIVENPIKGNCENIAQCSSSVPLEKLHQQECSSSVSLEKLHQQECSSSVPLEKLHQQECSSSVSLEKLHKRDACATLEKGEPND